MINLWKHFQSEWSEYWKVTFDGPNRLIIVNASTTTLDIKQDVYSDWKEWASMAENAKYLPAIRTIGGDPVGEGQFAGDLYFLMNGWRLVINLSKVRVIGVLVSDDYPTAYYDANLNAVFPASVSSLVTTISVKENVVTGDVSQIQVPTSDENAQAVWNRQTSQHTQSGTFGKLMSRLLTVSKYLGLK